MIRSLDGRFFASLAFPTFIVYPSFARVPFAPGMAEVAGRRYIWKRGNKPCCMSCPVGNGRIGGSSETPTQGRPGAVKAKVSWNIAAPLVQVQLVTALNDGVIAVS